MEPPFASQSELNPFECRLADYRRRIDTGITQWLPPSGQRPTRIHDAMRYAMTNGGKRLRPALLLAAFDLCPSESDPIPAAVAIECIHAYSLVHDDLPCMDNSDLRRGLPTCHRKYDEATAVLAGDALLTEAFFIISSAYASKPLSGIALVRELADAAGSRHLIAGQVEDTFGEGKILTESDIEFIHLNKTAALISAAMAMGVSLGANPTVLLDPVREIGRLIGLAFQAVDDLLDVVGTSTELGKVPGSDLRRHKNTAISLHGVDATRSRVRAITQAALDACQELDADTAFLRNLIASLEHRAK